MYQLVTAYVQPRGKWVDDLETDVSQIPVRTLFSTSLRVILVLTHPSLANPQTLDLADAETQVYQLHPDMTFAQWFVELGSSSLPTRDGLPTITTKRVRSVQAFIAGFDVQVWDKGVNIDLPETTGLGKDLKLIKYFDPAIEKPGDYLLCSVNGAMHITDFNNQVIFVEGGGFSTDKARAPSVMLHSFKDVGKVKQIPFTNCIFNGPNESPMNSSIWVQIPEVIGNRTVMLSIAGILYTDPETWAVTGERNISIDTSHLRLREHYLATRDLIDWSHVEEMMGLDPDKIDGLYESIFKSDEALTAILNMPQTFIILVDAPVVRATNKPLEMTSLPGKYYAYGEADYPLRLSNGLLPAFVPIRERVATKRPMWVLGCEVTSSRRRNLFTDTRALPEYDFMPNTVQSQFPFDYAAGYKLSIESIDIDIPELL